MKIKNHTGPVGLTAGQSNTTKKVRKTRGPTNDGQAGPIITQMRRRRPRKNG